MQLADWQSMRSSGQSAIITVLQAGKLLQTNTSPSTRCDPPDLFLVLHMSLRHLGLASAALVLEELLLTLLGGSLLQECQFQVAGLEFTGGTLETDCSGLHCMMPPAELLTDVSLLRAWQYVQSTRCML